MLKLINVRKTYQTKAGEVHALDGVSITFPKSGMVFITGKSGCGKTTLLNVIGGLDDVTSGEILVQDKKFSTFTDKEYDSYRNTYIGFIFQEYNLLPDFTVENNIKMAMELQGRETDEEELKILMKEVGISDLKDRSPSELSGGQRQRVAIARALVKRPHIIMADEPTGALDSAIGIQVLDTLKELSKDKLIIIVSHDMDFAEKYADRIIHLVDGKVESDISFTDKAIDGNTEEKEGSFIVKEGSDLDETEKNALAKAIKDRKKIEFVDTLSFRDKSPTGKIKHDTENPVELNYSKMKFKSAGYMGVKSLVAKPIRLIITIFVSALAFAIFGLFDTVANFSTAKVLRNLLENSASPTVNTSISYVANDEGDDRYSMRVDDATVTSFTKKTKGTVKGIYGFKGDGNASVTHEKPISELNSGDVFVGKKYYSNSVSGFIEFDSEKEINANGTFKDFNYKIVAGRYPRLVYKQDIIDSGESLLEGLPVNSESATYQDNLILETLTEVAISTYMADSIIYYLRSNPLHGKPILTQDDLLGCSITVDSTTYRIVGIIDCGKIPQKYTSLRTGSTIETNNTMLGDDFDAFMDAGVYKCLFVGKKFIQEWEKLLNIHNYNYVGNTYWDFKIDGSSARNKIADYAFSSKPYDDDNIILFTGHYPNGRLTLADDEVLIHHNNLRYLYDSAWSNISFNERQEVTSLIENMIDGTRDENRETLKSIFAKMSIEGAPVPITINSTSTKSGDKITKSLKIVGCYFGVDDSKGLSSAFKLMMNENLMEEFNIFSNQGAYIRLLFSPKSVKNGSEVIVKSVLSADQLSLKLHNNSALKTITDNEDSIRQIADIFLYVAIALALFSVFMLYNYISASISRKKQSVGVLRALGACSKDILITFLIESVIIGLINVVLANIFALVGCYIVNSYIANTMFISINFAIFGIRQVLFIAGICLLTAIISCALPIIRIAKKKPVELIRRP